MAKKQIAHRRYFSSSLLLISVLLAASSAFAQGTAFTYQGKSTDASTSATGNYDMQFLLFDTSDVGTGTQQGLTITNPSIPVASGFFRATLAFVATFAASQAQAAEFAVIIANLNDAKDPQAQIDVAVDTQALPGGAPATVYFNVFGTSGAQIAEFEVLTNQNGFASSSSAAPPYDNLFTVSGGLPALVTVRTPTTASIAGVVLRQKSKESEVVVDVPRVRRSDGTFFAAGRVFSVPIGDIVHTATLLIANFSGTDIAVDLFIGTKGAPGGGKYNNPRILNNALWIVDIDPADMDSHLIVSSTGAVIVQLAIDDGEKGALTEGMVMPVP